MREQFKHWERISVRWGDMDAIGHVNNAKYFTYCESVRISYFEAIELWRFREHDRQGPALVSATCNFRQQVHYPAELDVGARTSEIRNRSFTLEYEIYRRDSGELVADGSSVVAWVDYEANKAIPIPDELRAAIRRFEGME
jgi:acyl-CoA thioester hydrolase